MTFERDIMCCVKSVTEEDMAAKLPILKQGCRGCINVHVKVFVLAQHLKGSHYSRCKFVALQLHRGNDVDGLRTDYISTL